jgi:hypothetical protein
VSSIGSFADIRQVLSTQYGKMGAKAHTVGGFGTGCMLVNKKSRGRETSNDGCNAAISSYHFTFHFPWQEEVQRNVVLRQSTPEAELQRRGLCLLKLTVYFRFRMSGIEF